MLTGCGGDDEDDSEPPAVTERAPAPTVTGPVTAPPPETTVDPEQREPEPEPRTVPEEELQGDEEAIRSEAVFTGRGGDLGPKTIKVPPFIAIRVILRNGDGRNYSLHIGGESLFVGHATRTDEAKLDGLLPNRGYDGESPQGNVRVEASAEPGP